MKLLTVLFVLVLSGNLTFGQKNVSQDTGKDKQESKKTENQDNQADKKSQETQTVHIVTGSSGVKRSIGYKFSSLPEDSDPGNGIFRYNNETVSQITYIIVDDKDLTGEDQTNWYKTWDDTTGATARGELIIADIEGNIVNVFDVTGVFVDYEGFWKVPVKYTSGGFPSDGAIYYYVFNRIAHKKNEADQSNQPDQQDITAVQVIPAEESKPEAEVPAVEQTIPVEQVIVVTNVDTVEGSKPAEVVTPVPVEVPIVEQAIPFEPVIVVTNVDAVEEAKPAEVVNPDPVEVPVVEQAIPVEPVIAVTNVDAVEEAKPTEEVIPNPLVNIVEQVVITEEAKPFVEVSSVEQAIIIEPVKQANTPEPEAPVIQVITVEEPDPIAVAEPVAAVNPVVQVIIPAEEVKPVIETAKAEPAVPVETTRIDERIRAEELKPVRQARPVEEKKPVRQTRPAPVPQNKVAEPKPVSQPNFNEQPEVQQTKPVEQSKPVIQQRTRPSQETRKVLPVAQNKPVEQSKPVVQPETTEPARPVQETRIVVPVARNKPAEQPKPIVQPKTTENARPVQETRTVVPVARNKPAELPKPAEEVKPREQVTLPYQGTQSYQLQEVKTETRDNQFAATQNNIGTTSRKHRKCYRGIIEVGYGLGAGDYGINNFRFNFINGFHIGPNFSLGLGLGIRRYFIENENYTDRSFLSGKVQIPVFIDFRTTLSSRKLTPYFAMGIGNSSRYSAKSDSASIVNEGLLFNSSAGIWFNISDRFAVFGGIAYEMQKMEYLKLSDDTYYKKNTSSVSLNIGISF